MSDDLYLKNKKARTIDGWRASLEIFERHGKTDKWLIVASAHDIFYTQYGTDDIPEDSDDGRALIALGWHVDEDAWACFA